jgi:hypothetical protein
MFHDFQTLVCFTAVSFLAIGCQTQSDPTTSGVVSEPAHVETDGHQHDGDAHDDHGDSDVATAMAKLSPEDRKEAEVQKFCAVMGDSLLGSMGTPLKVEIKGEPVFLCCSGCKSKALKNPDQTLAAVAKMKAEHAAEEK